MSLNKNLSQVILVNNLFIKLIVSFLAPINNGQIIEIGAGKGALSFNLKSNSIKFNFILNLIEIDYNFCNILKIKIFNVNIFNISILNFNFYNLIKKFNLIKIKFLLLGNLPYNISSFILYYLLNFINIIKEQYFMLQIELAKKLTFEKINFKISIILKSFYRINFLFTVKKIFFNPIPSVDSAFIKMQVLYLSLIRIDDLFLMEKFLNLIFLKKKKILKYIFFDYINIINFNKFDINLNLRCNSISIDKYILLFYEFKKYSLI